MTRDIILIVSIVLGIILLIAHVVLRLCKKSIKLRMTMISIAILALAIAMIASKGFTFIGFFALAMSELVMDSANYQEIKLQKYKQKVNDIIKLIDTTETETMNLKMES